MVISAKAIFFWWWFVREERHKWKGTMLKFRNGIFQTWLCVYYDIGRRMCPDHQVASVSSKLFFKRRVSYWERVLMPTWTACFGRRCRQHFLLIVFLQHVLIFTPYRSLSCSPLISCEALILRPRVCWWNEWVTLSFVHICSYVLKEQCTTSVIWILHVCYIPRCFIVLGQYYKWNFPPNIPFYFQLVTVGFVDM